MHLKSKARDFVDYWCVSENGKRYWYNKALSGFLVYHEGFKTTDIGEGGVHIDLADYLELTPNDNNVETEFSDALKEHSNAVVIIVTGPIGCGKSTVAQRLYQRSPEMFEHIDGDVLGFNETLVRSLKAERNDFTMWKVVETLMNGKIPIISTGGGAIVDGKGVRLELDERITKALHIRPMYITLTPVMNDMSLERIYKESDVTRKAVVQRLRSGKWTATGKEEMFIDEIVNRSRENYRFACTILSCTDYHFEYDPVTPSNFNFVNPLTVDTGNKILCLCTTYGKSVGQSLKLSYQQLRVLVYIDTIDMYKHITLSYDDDRSTEVDLKYLRSTELGVCKGKLYTLHSKNDKKKKISVVLPEKLYHSDGSTHITINSGQHLAKKMRDVAIAIRKSQSEILVDSATYLNTGDYTEVIVNCLCVFCI